MRILVTGSRHWADEEACRRAIEAAMGEVPARECTLVHGAAPGADTVCARIGAELGMRVEAHPAQWAKYGRRAGPIRNAEMVRGGANVCLAFPLGASPGTRHCAGLAAKAGIPVVWAGCS